MNLGEFTIKIDTSPIDEAQAKADALLSTLRQIHELQTEALPDTNPPLLGELQKQTALLERLLAFTRRVMTIEGDGITTRPGDLNSQYAKSLGQWKVDPNAPKKPEGQIESPFRIETTSTNTLDPAMDSVRFEVTRLPVSPQLAGERVMTAVLRKGATRPQIRYLSDCLSDALQKYESVVTLP